MKIFNDFKTISTSNNQIQKNNFEKQKRNSFKTKESFSSFISTKTDFKINKKSIKQNNNSFFSNSATELLFEKTRNNSKNINKVIQKFNRSKLISKSDNANNSVSNFSIQKSEVVSLLSVSDKHTEVADSIITKHPSSLCDKKQLKNCNLVLSECSSVKHSTNSEIHRKVNFNVNDQSKLIYNIILKLIIFINKKEILIFL